MSCSCQHLHPQTPIPYPQLLSKEDVVHLLESVDEGKDCSSRAKTQEISARYLALESCLRSNGADAQKLISRVFKQSAAGSENGRLFQALIQLAPGLSTAHISQLMGSDRAYIHLFYDKQAAQRRNLVDSMLQSASFSQLRSLWELGRQDLWHERLVISLIRSKEGLSKQALEQLLEMFPDKHSEILASCAFEGRLSIVRSMMELGLPWPSRDAKSLEGLLYAISRQDLSSEDREAFKRYLEAVELDTPVNIGRCGSTPWIYQFAWSGHQSACAFLIELGADIRADDTNERGTLLERTQLNPALWQLLIEAGAHVSVQALHRMVRSESMDKSAAAKWKPIIELMQERGLDINEATGDGQQLLRTAAYSSTWVTMLKSLGARERLSCSDILLCGC